ncbi:MAG: hypothetical protein JWR37_3454 [Mycobacterium sp.]|jgi:sodium/bile acid cotransporter 7|nr:hypothetical protein [Mycobacterium sp.]
MGQSLRPWISGWVQRHSRVTKAFDRAAILLVVYTAFSISMTEHIWSTVSPWRLVAVTVVCAVLLAIMLGVTVGMDRLARLNPADSAVLPDVAHPTGSRNQFRLMSTGCVASSDNGSG